MNKDPIQAARERQAEAQNILKRMKRITSQADVLTSLIEETPGARYFHLYFQAPEPGTEDQPVDMSIKTNIPMESLLPLLEEFVMKQRQYAARSIILPEDMKKN